DELGGHTVHTRSLQRHGAADLESATGGEESRGTSARAQLARARRPSVCRAASRGVEFVPRLRRSPELTARSVQQIVVVTKSRGKNYSEKSKAAYLGSHDRHLSLALVRLIAWTIIIAA
ncbi:unnamed protein product, partial [Ectocarpus sp. 8 AP-2014]